MKDKILNFIQYILDWFHDILEKIFGNWAEFKFILLIWILVTIFLIYYSGYKDGLNAVNIEIEE